LNEQFFQQTRIRKAPTLRFLSTVAAAACIIAVIIISWPSETTRKLDQLGETSMIGITERGNQTDTLLQKASTFFNEKQFDKALPILNQAVIADSSSQLALFYRGVAAWHTGDLHVARTSLRQVYDKGSVLQNQAAYYMALTYAGEKNKTLALEWLQKIPATAPEHVKIIELEDFLK
jgi:tetratricopeptide (TPR) repeat protein